MIKLNLLKSTIFRNIFNVGIVVLFLKIVALLKQRYIGSAFGLTESLDSFYILLLLPSFIKTVFIGAYKTVFIPNYIKTKDVEKDIFENNLTLLTIIFSLFLIMLCYILIIPINNYLVQNYSVHIKNDVFYFQNYLLVCIPMWCFTAVLSGFLDINKRFVISASYPIISSLIILGFLFFYNASLEALIVGTIVGSFFELLYLVLFYKVKFRIKNINLASVSTLIFIKQFFPKLLSGIIIGLNPFIDQIFSSRLAFGAISTLNYGSKIPSFAISILSIALGNVLLPFFSEISDLKPSIIFSKLKKYLLVSFLIGLSCTIFLWVFNLFIVQIIFESGSFDQVATKNVSYILKMFSLQIPFYLMNIIIVRFLTAFNLNIFNIISSSISVIINFLANSLLIDSYGIAGIALSTSIVLFFAFIFKFIYVYLKFSKNDK